MIVITYTDTHIDIDLNALYGRSDKIDDKDARFRRDDLKSVSNRGDHVRVKFHSNTSAYECNLNGSKGRMPIASVNGVNPENIEGLASLLKNMIP